MRLRIPGDQSTGHQPTYIVDKMLRNMWLVGYIHWLLPDACVLHVARHPLDTAMSCYAQPFGYSGMPWAFDLSHIAAQLNMTQQLVDHWNKVLPGKLHTVYYEDLVLNTEQVTRELLSACGLDWEDAVLSFHATERAVHTASVTQVRQPMYTSSVGRWRVYESQLHELKDMLKPLTSRWDLRSAVCRW